MWVNVSQVLGVVQASLESQHARGVPLLRSDGYPVAPVYAKLRIVGGT